MHTMRKGAWVYVALFVGVVSLGYIPGFTDAQGRLFGLFAIELKDDILHLASALWAALAALRSRWASLKYFQIFGPVYFGDGVLGLVAGNGYLDLAIMNHGPAFYGFPGQLFANVPHLLIGGVAIWIGYVLSKRLPQQG